MRRSFLYAGLLVLVGTYAVTAQALDVFTIENVPVDVTDTTAAAARDRAIAEAQRIAFGHMLQRVTLPADYDRLPPFDPNRRDELVRGFRVESEKLSPVRYLGELTIEFKPEAVRQVLREAGIRFAETPSKPVVVVPIYQEGNRLLLWDDINPWRAAWGSPPSYWGLVPFVVPLGDLADIATVDADAAASGDAPRLAQLSARYGGGDALVALAELRGIKLEVTVRRFGVDENGAIAARHSVLVGDDLAAAMSETIGVVFRQVDETWKQKTLVLFGSEDTLVALVTFSSLGEWREVNRRLNNVGAVRQTDILAMGRGRGQVELRYVGNVQQLTLAMAQSDLLLEPSSAIASGLVGNAAWTIRLRPGAAIGPTTPVGATPTVEAPAPADGDEEGAAAPSGILPPTAPLGQVPTTIPPQ